MENLSNHFEPTTSTICEVKTKHSGLKPYSSLLYHTDLCELVTLLLTRGIQMGDMSKLGWLIRLVKHAI
jgi:hypothetical protein